MTRKWIVENVPRHASVLDLGCGTKWYWSALTGRGCSVVGVDAHEPFEPCLELNLEESDLPIISNAFDVVLMIDFIEHLSRDRGLAILRQAKRIAALKILLVTPLIWNDNAENVEDPCNDHYGNDFDYHRSLWAVEDFEGWKRYQIGHAERFFGIWRNQ
jgi:SAM-dependent methyltransferase